MQTLLQKKLNKLKFPSNPRHNSRVYDGGRKVAARARTVFKGPGKARLIIEKHARRGETPDYILEKEVDGAWTEIGSADLIVKDHMLRAPHTVETFFAPSAAKKKNKYDGRNGGSSRYFMSVCAYLDKNKERLGKIYH
jgi:hypothetical protein